jgi:hypothetical protein
MTELASESSESLAQRLRAVTSPYGPAERSEGER